METMPPPTFHRYNGASTHAHKRRARSAARERTRAGRGKRRAAAKVRALAGRPGGRARWATFRPISGASRQPVARELVQRARTAVCSVRGSAEIFPSAPVLRAHKGHGASADEERWPVSLAEKEGREPGAVAGVKRSEPAGAATTAHQARVQATAVNGASREPLRRANRGRRGEKSASGQRRPDVSLALINSTYFVQRAARHRILISPAPAGKKSPPISETPREGGRVTCDPSFFVLCCAVLYSPKLLLRRSAHGRRGVPPAASAHKLPASFAHCSEFSRSVANRGR